MMWIIFAVAAFFVAAIFGYKLTEDTDYEGFVSLTWLPAIGVGVFDALGLWLIRSDHAMAGRIIIVILLVAVIMVAIWQARRFIEVLLAIVLVVILLLGMPISAIAADFMPFKFAKQTEVDATAEALEKIADNTETIADNTANFGISGTADTTELTIDTVGHWIHFYNLDLIGTDDQFNFGPKPNCSSAEEYDKEFRERLKRDPALAAAATAWLDANVGTRYLGVFYESCKEDWAETINTAKDDFAADQMDFYHDLDAFFAFIDTAEVSVRDCKDVTDQMYMNPFTASGIPDVIVFETTDQSGQELVYTFNIKGNKVEVAYRIDCGYQPTNVAEIMKITPQEKPEAKKSTTTTTKKSTTTKKDTTPEKTPEKTPDPTPTPTPTPTPDPDPTPDPTPEYNKDPEKAPKENTEPNDDPGPGEDTNNGEGATESTKDQPTNSNHYDSYDDYQKDIQDLKETNETQKTGGDSNEPSTPAPSQDTKVDKGTGNGGIDTPTQTQKPATEAGTGNAINDSPGEAWEGPAD